MSSTRFTDKGTLCRTFDPLSFDPLSFDPLSFDPVSFDPLSVNLLPYTVIVIKDFLHFFRSIKSFMFRPYVIDNFFCNFLAGVLCSTLDTGPWTCQLGKI